MRTHARSSGSILLPDLVCTWVPVLVTIMLLASGVMQWLARNLATWLVHSMGVSQEPLNSTVASVTAWLLLFGGIRLALMSVHAIALEWLYSAHSRPRPKSTWSDRPFWG